MGERITDNTLIRVAVDLLLARAGELNGTTEDSLRQSVASIPVLICLRTCREFAGLGGRGALAATLACGYQKRMRNLSVTRRRSASVSVIAAPSSQARPGGVVSVSQ